MTRLMTQARNRAFKMSPTRGAEKAAKQKAIVATLHGPLCILFLPQIMD